MIGSSQASLVTLASSPNSSSPSPRVSTPTPVLPVAPRSREPLILWTMQAQRTFAERIRRFRAKTLVSVLTSARSERTGKSIVRCVVGAADA
jgi:hypothetical protein